MPREQVREEAGGIVSRPLEQVRVGWSQRRPKSLARKPVPGSLGWPGQRCAFGTPAMTWSTCWPQPAQVGWPHFRQVTCLHMVVLHSVVAQLCEKRMSGRMRLTHEGAHQAARPVSRSRTGSRTSRTRMASSRTATANTMPISLGGSGPGRREGEEHRDHHRAGCEDDPAGVARASTRFPAPSVTEPSVGVHDDLDRGGGVATEVLLRQLACGDRVGPVGLQPAPDSSVSTRGAKAPRPTITSS